VLEFSFTLREGGARQTPLHNACLEIGGTKIAFL